MTGETPRTELDARYGEPQARPMAWADAEMELAKAEVFWLTTVRPEGRPHVTPLLAVWSDGALCFSTGAREQKARNVEQNDAVTLTTGSNALHGGTDLVVEGTAALVRDESRLRVLADAWVRKYGEEWRFGVADGAFVGAQGNVALVFEVRPRTAYGFGKGPYSQTTWRF